MNKLYPDDLELISNIKKDICTDDCLKQLESRHSGICHQMIKRYYNSFVEKGIDPIDVTNEKNYIIYQSVLNFDESKNVKFSTWLGNQMRYYCLNCLNKNKNVVFFDNPTIIDMIDKKDYKENQSFFTEKNYIFNLISQLKDPRIKKIFELRYFLSSNKKLMSWSKIGKKLKISTQTAINLHNKTIDFLNNKYKSKNFLDKV